MAHTPGPWKVISRGYPFPGLRVWTAAENLVADLEICMINNLEEYEGQRLADARLIAAAPDLLKAAEEAVAALEPLPLTWELSAVFETLRRAIAKAKGE